LTKSATAIPPISDAWGRRTKKQQREWHFSSCFDPKINQGHPNDIRTTTKQQ